MKFSWDLPYPSSRQPVMARNVVATSQPLAAQAGISALRAGGNAVDAALATAIALTVVEPTMNGIGSDAFALVWTGGRLHGLNASGRSPKAWTPDRFKGLPSMPRFGWDAVTVPGCVSAWVALSERFGRLPFERLFDDAIRYAREGFAVSPITAPRGRTPDAGELFRSPDHAQTLETIASSRGEAFYRGALAETIAAAARSEGGALTAEDLAAHQCDWVDPIGIAYAGHRLHEIPPNGQGLAALICLGILANTPLQDHAPDSADAVHLQIEAMKLAFADAHRYVADPAHMDVRTESLLDPAYHAERARLIDVKRAGTPEHGTPKDRGTVLLCAADAEGMMVSFIQSNFGGFGSGVVVPGTGIALQNRANGFSLQPGHPNEVGGGKRPFHTIIPAFATRNGEPAMAFGVMGGAFQPQGHVQMAVRMLLHRQNPQAASDAPRWKVNEGLEVSLEHGFDPAVAEELARRGHRIRRENAAGFGGAQIITRLADGYCAGSDHRKDGAAVGY
ncbi:MAG: gamma-glutamyltranspeptidase / glutathione hydrolase [Candidatus Sumerlaeota bacterium]|nr:gamma-glutamyltranspeptidase / glutathione hydrolase [Candidatus Sumerlaeota bacterium]